MFWIFGTIQTRMFKHYMSGRIKLERMIFPPVVNSAVSPKDDFLPTVRDPQLDSGNCQKPPRLGNVERRSARLFFVGRTHCSWVTFPH
jgi:hypothetical protein